jgi:molecular chaperone GrpE (heat shock protein)
MGEDVRNGMGAGLGAQSAGLGAGPAGEMAPAAAAATPTPDLDTLLQQVVALREAFDSKLKYDATKQATIDQLHQDLEVYRKGERERAIRSVLSDLISLYDDLDNLITNNEEAFASAPGVKRSLVTFRESIVETLRRNDVDTFSASGDIYDPALQRPLASVPTREQGMDNHIARRVRTGFRTPDRIIRQEMVDVYRYQP